MTEKKQHPHALLWRAIADGSADDMECHHVGWIPGDWRPTEDHLRGIRNFPRLFEIRRKQKTIRIGAMEVPEPMRVAPDDGAEYWVATPLGACVYNNFWHGSPADKRWLKHGACHVAKEAAEAHRRALILVSGGTP